jgi:short-subunit dehydrogenase
MERFAILTGATGAIGGAIAEGLAKVPNMNLMLCARNVNAGQKLAEELKKSSGAS